MAASNRLIATIYREQVFAGQSFDYPGNGGRANTFPSGLCRVYPAPASTTVNGVTMAAIIQLLPTGTNQAPSLFYTDSTVAVVQSSGT